MDLLPTELIREIGYFLNHKDYNNFITSFNFCKSLTVQYIAFENVKQTISKKKQNKFILDYSNLTFKEFIFLLEKRCENMCCKILKTNKKIDPSLDDNWALIHASHFGQNKVVELLLNHPRVDPSAELSSALIFASLFGHNKVVESLKAYPRRI